MGVQFVMRITFLLLLTYGLAEAAAAPPMARPYCSEFCGTVRIPYPFGMTTARCYLNDWFKIDCIGNGSSVRAFLPSINMEVLEIKIPNRYDFLSGYSYYEPGIVRVKMPIITSSNCTSTGLSNGGVNMTGGPFYFSSYRNKFISVGCNNMALMTGIDPTVRVGCSSDCDNKTMIEREAKCSGFNCCQTRVPSGNQVFNVSFKSKEEENNGSEKCKYAFLAEKECFGVLFLLLITWWLYKVIKKRNKIKLKKKFFKRNGGLILGKGGQGTFYKGMLIDGRIVTIKKCNIVDEGNLEQFINEIIILSQINHRNVVKLLGCGLETKVHLLVYEFISNGTLFQYLDEEIEDFPLLTWDMRLRIVAKIVGALSYLHSVASVPIYHRDIKSSNILLDEKYRAKIANFGTSKSVAIDQTHVTTLVYGTFGQFIEKCDVYSFGVVLIELLTGEKPVSSTRSQEGWNLSTYFVHSLKENCLFDILDTQVSKVDNKDEVMKITNLAKRCLHFNGKK
ncbi:hypothetical protein RGQ29_017213 [Quercus rubra]|uniref:Protein kinase domain-containing protein n=1 Tax=Quercus rubra TaxID=3512 RepID=A0AAN7FMR0_QUERU|nr:hypothetical protein RGQ29_017213 [Quercus rubra]